jgi:hypothetical protein
VNTHVCDVGVGAVLLQEGKYDIDLPMLFFLKTLTKIRKNNPQLKKKDLPYFYLCIILMYISSIRGVY